MRPGHWVAIDFAVGVAAAFYGLFVVGAAGATNPGTPGIAFHQYVVFRAVLVVALFLSVALRRSGPLVAFGVLLAVTAATVEIGSPTSILVLMPAAYVLYMVTVTGTKETGITALGTSLGLIAALMVVTRGVNAQPSVGILVALAMIIAWITGYSVRQRRAYAVMLQEQAASNAVAEERLRIARELHDVVAHSMSVIAVQAGYGQYVIDSKPAEASNALGAIQATSRDALDELRRMLGVLRQQDGVLRQQDAGAGVPLSLSAGGPQAVTGPAAGSQAPGLPTAGWQAAGWQAAGSRAPGPCTAAAPLAPAPGLADLDRLVQRTSGAGVQVSLRRCGRPIDLPAGVDLSAYRIVQEALTNVVRHAGGGTCCTVTVDYREEELAIEVTDDGGRAPVQAGAGIGAAGVPGRPFAATAGTGHGIIGMRERVNLCGGEFSAGRLSGGGFRVTALLPLGDGTTADGTPGSGAG
jgi:signal transduction histidine kinase